MVDRDQEAGIVLQTPVSGRKGMWNMEHIFIGDTGNYGAPCDGDVVIWGTRKGVPFQRCDALEVFATNVHALGLRFTRLWNADVDSATFFGTDDVQCRVFVLEERSR